jgi:ribonuclease H / adenosylcobalamin/alpha-ribazole phosphatase
VSRTIFFARHGTHAEVGHILSGRSEIPLNHAGRAEAARLAARLDTVELAAVQSSPRARARQTAEIVAARQGIPVEVVDALDEIDFGAWTGRAFADLAGDPAWDHWNRARGRATTPGGEDMTGAVNRAVAHVAELEEGEGPVLCVSHCDIIRGIVAHYLGLPLDRMLAYDCDPASVTTITLAGGDGRLTSLNERAA